MSRRLNVPRWWFVPMLAVFALVAAACGSALAGGSSGSPTMHIASPANGATVPASFTVKVDASVPLGDPSTGDDHVHLCFDGGSCDTEYKLVYGNTFAVNSLSPGTHTIEASLRNADHSPAGPTSTITVHVGAGASGSTAPMPGASSSSGGSTSTGSGSTGYGTSGSGSYGNGGY